MAGAGYKLFNTGDVLTAAQVNTYLMEQTVMRFATTTARDTALSGVLAEGMICYIDADNNLYKYTGSAWVNIDSGSTSPLTTKGDLYTYSTADARLAVGNNGETLVADSSATTGLRWQGDWNTGKNKFINADFRFNQRSFTSTTTHGTYGFDRWKINNSGGTVTYSAQTFTPGAAPVAGYEAINFARIVTSGQSAAGDYAMLVQQIEDVRTFAGQTVTVSFWAKANTGTPKIAVVADQYFGTGGSPSSDVLTAMGQPTISTSWARYSVTATIPSISGKTIGTNASTNCLEMRFFVSAGTNFNTQTNSLGIQSNTFDIWGVQIEAGSVATPFTTATGTLAGELAACQRYYYRITGTSNNGSLGTGFNDSTTATQMMLAFKQPMRIAPTAIETSGTAGDYSIRISGATSVTASAVPTFGAATTDTGTFNISVSSGLTAGQGSILRSVNANAYLAWSAEL